MQRLIFRAGRALLLSLALLAVPGLAAQASARSTVDLLSDANIRLDGQTDGDQAGFAVSGAGDVNGDGRDDVIVGAWFAENNGRTNSGSAYVLYGRASAPSAPIDLADTNGAAAGSGVSAADGFRIDGAANDNRAGVSVAAAGDVNGDGRDDVVLGANGVNSNAGSAYVLYGRATPPSGPVDLADTNGAAAGSGVDPAHGFRMDGASGDQVTRVAGAGDFNGDGRDDVIVGASAAESNDRQNSGSAYVIYGRATSPSTPIDLADSNGGAAGSGVDPAHGFRVDGNFQDQAGVSVAGAGDVNGDGRDDVIVGAFGAGYNGRSSSGSAYVLYGRASGPSGPVDLADTNGAAAGSGVDPGDGFRIDGAAQSETAGVSVARAGDINGDGREDMVVSARQASNNGRSFSGSAYVLYGRATPPSGPVDLADTNGASAGSGVDPAHGFRIDAAAGGDGVGWFSAVAGVGDANGDGRDDVIVGAPGADSNFRSGSGSAYVLYGRASPPSGPVDLADTNGAAAGSGVDPAHGFRIDGSAAEDQAGSAVAGPGDVDGDGRADVVVGASGADNNGRSGSGSAYVIYGADDPPTAVDDQETVAEGAATTTLDVLANDADPDGGEEKKVDSVTQPAHGTVAITNDGADLTYQPDPDYCNDPGTEPSDEFTYKLSPGGSEATVAVAVTCVEARAVYVDDASVAEGGPGANTTVNTRLRLAEPSPQPITVNYTSLQNTARGGGADYSGRSGSVTFAPGETEKNAGPFTVKGDSLKEGVENFQVKLTSVSTGDLDAGDRTGQVLISEDDGQLFATVNDVVVTEGNAGPTNAAFKVRLSETPAPGQTVSLQYATANGSASSSSDYSAQSGTLSFTNASGPEQTVNVPVQGDTGPEPNETLQLKLGTPKGLRISDTEGTATIVNDDGSPGTSPNPSVFSDDAAVLEGGPGANTTVNTKLRLSAPSAQAITVDYTSVRNTADGAGADYSGRSGSVTFAPGETEKNAGPFSVKGDSLKEGTENFQVKITSVATGNAGIGDGLGNVFIFDEEGPIFARITNASGPEGDSGSSNLAFEVSLSDTPPAGQTVSVRYATANGSASSSSDYSPQSGTLTFTNAGAPEQTVNVPVNGDTDAEPDETLKLKLGTPDGLMISDTEALGTIFSDDP